MNQQQIDALPVDQLWPVCCLAYTECKGCDGGIVFPCHHCEGKGPTPGRIWALPGMQERCESCLVFMGECLPPRTPQQVCSTPQHEGHKKVGRSYCGDCHGTGWVAKRDLGALLDLPQWRYIDINQEGDYAYTCRVVVGEEQHYGDAPKRSQALLRAVAQALVAQGAMLGAT